jgi:hypothetical protein
MILVLEFFYHHFEGLVLVMDELDEVLVFFKVLCELLDFLCELVHLLVEGLVHLGD